MNKENEITEEQVQELYLFLQGKCPDDLTIKDMPQLSKKQAFSVIYFLQEQLNIIPDKYEQCDICGKIFDSQSEGFIIPTEEPKFKYKDGDPIFYCEYCLYLVPDDDRDEE